uniref:Uncharacterized protein n=3 Tax=Meloidogyne TaxID=189290 RepID=A0A915N632_MELJA
MTEKESVQMAEQKKSLPLSHREAHVFFYSRTAVQPHYKADDTPCPQVAWKQLLEDGINENDAIASVNSIQTALFRRYETEQKFLVVCATADEAKAGDATANKVHFSSSGDGYCNVVKKNIWCQAVALSA